MRTLILLAALALTLAAATTASAYHVSPSTMTPAWLDQAPAPVVPILDTTDPLPIDPGPVVGCPDRPADLAPLAACPFDAGPYSTWMGDDADAPLWTHCNYNSGDANDPCPHSTADTPYFYVRCSTGEIASVERSNGTDPPPPDGPDASAENAERACPGGYVDLST